MTHDLRAPANRTYEDMRDGEVDFVASEAHAALAAFPNWQGVKLLCAQGQGMYWFLVMRSDIGAVKNDLSIVRGRRIGAAPWVELGLRRMLMAVNIDPTRDNVHIAPIPGSLGLKVNTGVTAAEALEDGRIDGFWANGMGAEVAVRRGVGTVVIDARQRRRAARLLRLHRRDDRHHRPADQRSATGRRRCDPRHHGHPGGAAGRPVAGHTSRPQAVPAVAGRVDRRPDRTRPALLRSRRYRGRSSRRLTVSAGTWAY